MRQIIHKPILLLLSFSLLLFSCTKDDESLTSADFIGEWETSEWFVLTVNDSIDYEFNRSILYPYKASFVTDNFNFYEFPKLIDLNSDFSYIKYLESADDDAFTVNDPDRERDGKWQFDNSKNYLSFDEGTPNSISLDLLIYYNDSFTLTEELLGTADFDEDGKTDNLKLSIKSTFVRRN